MSASDQDPQSVSYANAPGRMTAKAIAARVAACPRHKSRPEFLVQSERSRGEPEFHWLMCRQPRARAENCACAGDGSCNARAIERREDLLHLAWNDRAARSDSEDRTERSEAHND